MLKLNTEFLNKKVQLAMLLSVITDEADRQIKVKAIFRLLNEMCSDCHVQLILTGKELEDGPEGEAFPTTFLSSMSSKQEVSGILRGLIVELEKEEPEEPMASDPGA